MPCGYVPGLEPDSTRRIPGLKIETWGTRPVPYTVVTTTEIRPGSYPNPSSAVPHLTSNRSGNMFRRQRDFLKGDLNAGFTGFLAGLTMNECDAYVDRRHLLCLMDCRMSLLTQEAVRRQVFDYIFVRTPFG